MFISYSIYPCWHIPINQSPFTCFCFLVLIHSSFLHTPHPHQHTKNHWPPLILGVLPGRCQKCVSRHSSWSDNGHDHRTWPTTPSFWWDRSQNELALSNKEKFPFFSFPAYNFSNVPALYDWLFHCSSKLKWIGFTPHPWLTIIKLKLQTINS